MNFTEDQIKKAIFENSFPQVVAYPFQSFPNSPYRSYSVTFQLLSDRSFNFDQIILAINGCSSPTIDGDQLPLAIYKTLYDNYISCYKQWLMCLDKVSTIVDSDSVGRYLWISSKSIGLDRLITLGNPANVFQVLWIYYQTIRDRKEWMQLGASVLDNIQMWLQPQLYFKSKEQQENSRVNADYEKQHLAMLRNQFSPDNLDIVG